MLFFEDRASILSVIALAFQVLLKILHLWMARVYMGITQYARAERLYPCLQYIAGNLEMVLIHECFATFNPVWFDFYSAGACSQLYMRSTFADYCRLGKRVDRKYSGCGVVFGWYMGMRTCNHRIITTRESFLAGDSSTVVYSRCTRIKLGCSVL